MNEFLKWDDLVFNKADKGGAIVIQEVKNYIEKANRKLNNENYCKKLTRTHKNY